MISSDATFVSSGTQSTRAYSPVPFTPLRPRDLDSPRVVEGHFKRLESSLANLSKVKPSSLLYLGVNPNVEKHHP